jgi:hypothetical protein
MNAMIGNAHRAIQEPDVQDMLRRLSAYGLGIFMPHMHTETEDSAPLPRGMVQVESNLQVSFRPAAEAAGDAVGWIWDEQTKVATVCQVCQPETNGHKRLTHVE